MESERSRLTNEPRSGGDGEIFFDFSRVLNRGRGVDMRNHRLLRFLLPAFISAVLLAGGFSCNLLTGPHKSNGPDTTSSNFTWTIDTIGASGSYLYDVSIVDDSLAYAVGLIMPADSVGRNNTIYWNNAAVWNGREWKPFQVPYYYNGKKTFTTLHCVFARDPNDVWFESENWNGKTYTQSSIPFFSAYANKEWESPDGRRVYMVGTNGIIAYSPDHGTTWEQVQTGTTLPFQDIWGDGGQVLAVASDKFGLGGQYIVSLQGNTSTTVSGNGLQPNLSGIWFVAQEKYFVVGDGIYEKESVDNDRAWEGPFAPLKDYSYAIRGNDTNDVVVAGENGAISHYNGSTWRGFSGLVNSVDRLSAVAMKGNLIIAVGNRHESGVNYYGVIYIGRR